MKKALILALMILGQLATFAHEWTKEEVKAVIVKVNDTWQTSHPKQERSFWDPAVYHTGNMEAYFLLKELDGIGKAWQPSCQEQNRKNAETAQSRESAGTEQNRKNAETAQSRENAGTAQSRESAGTAQSRENAETALRWLEYSKAWGEKNKWMGATEPDPAKWKYKNYGEDMQHVLFGDWQICFQTYLDIYNADANVDENSLNPKPSTLNLIKRAKEVMEYEKNSEATDYWWWADALYMVMPVMTKMYKLTGDEGYLDKMYANWQYANSIMYDKETGLYFRDGKYVYPKHKTNAGKKDFWARGDGWVLAAFAKVLKDMPKKYKHRKEILKYYKRMAKAVIECQQAEGYWTRSMYDPEQAPGYETSGTALFCYGLLWGISNGVLSKKTYLPAAEKAWEYLSTVALQQDGTVGYVQPIGEKAIPGQVVNQKSVTNFGTGAFLLAACEYYRFIQSKKKE